jgi:DNA-binding Xre family transcriptional regulator
MAKLGKNETVQVEVLAKICNHLDCTMDDIMEVITDKA